VSGFAFWRPLRGALVGVTVASALTLAAPPASALKIDVVKSPGGIEAWLVQEPSVPLVAINFAFRGGTSQDPTGKPGVANMISALLDEGAGPYDSRAFHEALDERAVEERMILV
jgi:zinc protease